MKDAPERMTDAELLLEMADVLGDILDMPHAAVLDALITLGFEPERAHELVEEAKQRGLMAAC